MTTLTPTPTETLAELTRIIHFLHEKGWTPATSSNFSCRNPQSPETFYMSTSGQDKGDFTSNDFLHVNANGEKLEKQNDPIKPSAETLLHAMVYNRYPGVNTVLHIHSINTTVASKLFEADGGIRITDFEILKGLDGITTHEAEVFLPIFPNSQDIATLAKTIDTRFTQENRRMYAFLLAGHGLYTWGDSPAQAKRHIETLEFLLECILKLRSYGYSDDSR